MSEKQNIDSGSMISRSTSQSVPVVFQSIVVEVFCCLTFHLSARHVAQSYLTYSMYRVAVPGHEAQSPTHVRSHDLLWPQAALPDQDGVATLPCRSVWLGLTVLASSKQLPDWSKIDVPLTLTLTVPGRLVRGRYWNWKAITGSTCKIKEI